VIKNIIKDTPPASPARLPAPPCRRSNARSLTPPRRGYVIVNGTITMSGAGGELLERPEVKAAYLEGGIEAVSPRPAIEIGCCRSRSL
jgi:hypothetical protein